MCAVAVPQLHRSIVVCNVEENEDEGLAMVRGVGVPSHNYACLGSATFTCVFCVMLTAITRNMMKYGMSTDVRPSLFFFSMLRRSGLIS